METSITYRQAQAGDLRGIAEVFLAAFPESVQHYVGHDIPPDVVEDFFAVCLDSEPAAFWVAVVDTRIGGYVFAPAHLSQVFRTFIRRGYLWRMFGHWISGHYHIGLHPVRVAVRNWLAFWRESQEGTLNSDARILSIAVHPDFQGHHLGTGLMRVAMEYLRSQHVDMVRLEVRPENKAAIHLYEKFGFATKGTTRDTQGDWLIMLAPLGAGTAE